MCATKSASAGIVDALLDNGRVGRAITGDNSSLKSLADMIK